ncbi:MAG TPA: non-homologous end-joining DNA ligase [Gemmatimonadales bacterium]|nr:non-homologous end-joining DNA ligase [Gemmatimonadales bacterium]
MSTDPLSAYRAKRSADRTPEPAGVLAPVGTGGLFVVHKHAARRLHWDLRLELDGVLRSWAVPRGPSFDQKDKRLAVMVEDHPMEYANFEGLIPEGNYGAGAVIVWDRGEWIPIEDPHDGLRKGKLLFELRGYKLRGRWTLVKIKKEEKEWLLIKEKDAWLRKEHGEDIPQESVLSGLTVEDLKAGHTPAGLIRAEVEKLGALQKRLDITKVEPQLAEPRDEAFDREGWIFELKLDGYRILGARTADRPRLLSRNGTDYTGTFPEVARAVQALPVANAIVDGEVVVLDATGKPSFALLQQRARLSRQLDIARAAVELPATYFVFDLLGFEDFDLRPLPLVERTRLLRRLLPPLGALRFLDHFETRGKQLMAQVREMGLEGVIGKKGDGPYRAGRGPSWVKVRAEKTGDFAVVGFTPPRGSRGGFGALHLADWVGGRLVYAGRAGSGFTDRMLKELLPRLEERARDTPPCEAPVGFELEAAVAGTELGETTPPKKGKRVKTVKQARRPPAKKAQDWVAQLPDLKGTTWVEPELVAEVRFTEWTPDGVLRHPVFARFRDDKAVKDVIRQEGPGVDGAEPYVSRAAARPATPAEPVQPKPASADPPTVALSNLKKVYWPEDGYTKGDLIEYYRSIAPRLLPYMIDRPLVLTRYPDGIHGKSFYQKDAPSFSPEWIRTVGIWSEDTQREIRFFVVESVEALVYIANMGSIPLHLWASRVATLERPDWCVIDLDPKEAPFSDVITVAQVLHEICEDIGLPNFVKTTGKTGLHILLPLGRQCTYEQSRVLGELLARLVIRRLPKITTITRQVERRGVKVYLDYLQNRFGQTIVAPYSVRPLPGATVSMPLLWDEVNETLDPKNYTIRNALERLDRLGDDPCLPVIEMVVDLGKVLEKLAGK